MPLSRGAHTAEAGGSGAATRAGDPSCPFRAPREAAPSRSVLPAPCVRPVRPLCPLPPLRSLLTGGEGWDVPPGEFDPLLFTSRCARGCERLSQGCLALLSGPGRAAWGRWAIAQQVWGCPLCASVLCLREAHWERAVSCCGAAAAEASALGPSSLLPHHLVVVIGVGWMG